MNGFYEDITVILSVNGVQHELRIDSRLSLLDALRERLQLSGTKKGCNQGACGACTVLADGQRINSCLALAVQYQNTQIITIEGLSEHGQLHPLQTAFIEHDGFQCGYCTPGQICSSIGMMSEFKNHTPSAVTKRIDVSDIEFSTEEIRERLSGNLCRCGAYNGIVAAVQQVFEPEAKG